LKLMQFKLNLITWSLNKFRNLRESKERYKEEKKDTGYMMIR